MSEKKVHWNNNPKTGKLACGLSLWHPGTTHKDKVNCRNCLRIMHKVEEQLKVKDTSACIRMTGIDDKQNITATDESPITNETARAITQGTRISINSRMSDGAWIYQCNVCYTCSGFLYTNKQLNQFRLEHTHSPDVSAKQDITATEGLNKAGMKDNILTLKDGETTIDFSGKNKIDVASDCELKMTVPPNIKDDVKSILTNAVPEGCYYHTIPVGPNKGKVCICKKCCKYTNWSSDINELNRWYSTHTCEPSKAKIIAGTLAWDVAPKGNDNVQCDGFGTTMFGHEEKKPIYFDTNTGEQIKSYTRVIHFNGMKFNFAVNPIKKVVHGWVDWTLDIGHGKINKEDNAEVTINSCVLIKQRIEATVRLDDIDNFYPLGGIGYCILKLMNKIDQSHVKKHKRRDWHDFKDYLNNEVTKRRKVE